MACELSSSLRLVLCRLFQELGVISGQAASRTATDDDDIPIKGTSGPYRAGIDEMTKVDVFTGRI
jgi:hypothetical protein